MADITASVVAWSGTEASNQPTGDTTIGAGLDDNLRAIQAGVAREFLKGSDIASSSSITPGASGSYGFVDVTGTTTITSLGTAPAGTARTLRFTGALTLTHNGTSLIIPGSANITTQAGDVGEFVSLGSGNWVLTNWTPRNVYLTNTTFSMSSSSSGNPTIDYTNSTSDSSSSKFRFFKSRSSATTNSGDSLGLFQFFGKDTSNVDRPGGYMQFAQGGSAGSTFIPGQYVVNLTDTSGGDIRVLSATATAVNVPVPLQENATRVFSRNAAFVSSEQTVSNNTVTPVGHGFTGIPTLATLSLRCKTADIGYSVNEEVDLTFYTNAGGTVQLSRDATNCYIVHNNSINLVNKGSPGTISTITNSSWRWVVRAWF